MDLVRLVDDLDGQVVGSDWMEIELWRRLALEARPALDASLLLQRLGQGSEPFLADIAGGEAPTPLASEIAARRVDAA